MYVCAFVCVYLLSCTHTHVLCVRVCPHVCVHLWSRMRELVSHQGTRQVMAGDSGARGKRQRRRRQHLEGSVISRRIFDHAERE